MCLWIRHKATTQSTNAIKTTNLSTYQLTNLHSKHALSIWKIRVLVLSGDQYVFVEICGIRARTTWTRQYRRSNHNLHYGWFKWRNWTPTRWANDRNTPTFCQTHVERRAISPNARKPSGSIRNRSNRICAYRNRCRYAGCYKTNRKIDSNPKRATRIHTTDHWFDGTSSTNRNSWWNNFCRTIFGVERVEWTIIVYCLDSKQCVSTTNRC